MLESSALASQAALSDEERNEDQLFDAMFALRCSDCRKDLGTIGDEFEGIVGDPAEEQVQCNECNALVKVLNTESGAPGVWPQRGTPQWSKLREMFINLNKVLGAPPNATILVASWSMQSGGSQVEATHLAPQTPGGASSSAASSSAASAMPATTPRGKAKSKAKAFASPARSLLPTSLAPPSSPMRATSTPLRSDAGANPDRDAADPTTENLPLNSWGIDHPLPTGTFHAALGRMRGTVIEHTIRFGVCRWFLNFKIAQVQSLHKRLSDKAPKIVGGANVDLQIGYSQMMARLDALMEVYKVMKATVDTQNEASLGDILALIRPVERYLRYASIPVAPDMRIVLMHAGFRQSLKSGSALDQALATINFKELEDCYTMATEQITTNPQCRRSRRRKRRRLRRVRRNHRRGMR